MNTLISRVSSAVFDLCSEFHRGLLLVEGQIQPVVPELAELLKSTIAGRRGDPIQLLQDPRVLDWSEVHRKFGSNPAKYPPAHVALLKRVQNGNPIPPINNAVTIMTIISLKHVAPCGGDDVSGVEVAELRLADGDEAFIPLGSSGAQEVANKNEVIYYARPTNVTMCRRFCWRNSHLSRICDNTKRILMNFDMLGSDAASRAEAARDEAAELFERYCCSQTLRAMLSRVHSEHAFIAGSGYVN